MFLIDTNVVNFAQKRGEMQIYKAFSHIPVGPILARKHSESDRDPKPPIEVHTHARQLQDVSKFVGALNAGPEKTLAAGIGASNGLGDGDAQPRAVRGTGLADNDVDVAPERVEQPEQALQRILAEVAT